MHSWVNSEAGTQVNSAALYTRPSRRQPEPRAEPRRPPRWARGPEGPIAIARPRRERGADRTARARCVCYITNSPFSIRGRWRHCDDLTGRALQQVRPISWSRWPSGACFPFFWGSARIDARAARASIFCRVRARRCALARAGKRSAAVRSSPGFEAASLTHSPERGGDPRRRAHRH